MDQSKNKIDIQKPKLLDQVRFAIRTKHYSIRTEEAYVSWIKRYILFHKKRHPKEMRERKINQYALEKKQKSIFANYLAIRLSCLTVIQ